MSRHLFTFAVPLLLLVMCCTGEAAAADGSKTRSIIDPFTGTTSISFANWKELREAGSKITSLRVPSLVEVQGHLFAIAEAHCRDGGDCSEVGFTGIASKYLGLNVDSGPTEILTADASTFGADLLKEGSEGINTANGITRPTTLVLGDSVYMLLGNYSHTKPQVEGTNEPALLLVKGTLTDEGEKKKIRWNETHVVNPEPKGKSRFLTELIGGGGSGVVMRDGTIVFPMQAKGKDGTSFLLSMSFDPSDKKWELSYETPGKGCRDPTLVRWEKYEYGAELFMMAHCAGGYYDVYMSTPHGVNWNGHFQPITRVWGNSHNRKGHGVQSGSTTAIIEGKEVMLITAPVYPKEDNKGGKGRLHLWVTDKARVYDVGPVSREGDDAAASSLLIKDKNKELISLYENKKSDGAYNLVAVRLTEKLERIKEVVKKWKDLDRALKTCRSGSSAAVDPRKKGMCNGRVPTDGLVGFLSGNSTQTEWRDEYLGVNATVTNGEKRVPNGLTFQGPGAGAEWPVGDMGQTVPYYFANNKFTLVATVSIHKVPETGSIPLMGVKMNDTDSTVLFGLSYTNDKKWLAIPEDPAGNVEDFVKWEPNRTYQVVLRMDHHYWTVFVDREEIQKTKYNESLFDSHRISHFYIGGDSKHQSATGGHVTVTNVMLYNEELWRDDLYKLHASKVNIPSLGVEEKPTEQVTSTDVSVVSESWSEESVSYEELTEDDTDEQEEEIVDDLLLAAYSSTVDAESSVHESATAAQSAENSHQEDNAQLSGGETAQQTTLNEAKESMQRDSYVQPQDLQSEKSTVFNDVETSPESIDTEEPEEEGEADGRSGGTTSPVAASLSMETVAASVNGEHQVQQKLELSAENNDVRSTGTGNTGAEESLILEARDGNSERTMGSGSSPTPSKSDAEPSSAENTDDVFRTEGTEFPVENGKEVPQTVDTAPGNTNTTPGGEGIPSTKGAARHSDNDTFTGEIADLLAMGEFSESTVHGCVSRVLLLLLLGLWGAAALC
ncbi:sialidase-like protein [Trypanosoma cruzi]|nr:sialidase-like protein [Trypanosoma cruzi]